MKADEQYEWVRLEERSTTDAVQEIFRQNILTPLHSPALIKMGHGISTDSKVSHESQNVFFFFTGIILRHQGSARINFFQPELKRILAKKLFGSSFFP